MKKMVSEVKDELEVLREKDKVSHWLEEMPDVDVDTFVRRKLGHHAKSLESDLLDSSPLSGTRIGPSLSTKLNFILSEVSTHTWRHPVPHGPSRFWSIHERKNTSYSPIRHSLLPISQRDSL
jgi:hypothetical protein